MNKTAMKQSIGLNDDQKTGQKKTTLHYENRPIQIC